MTPSGFGVAVGHENVDRLRSAANLFVTKDRGGHWRQQDPNNSLGLLRRAVQAVCLSGPSWPIEQFASLAAPTPDCLALAWSDPGLFEDGAESHVVCTTDQATSWKYHCLGDSNPYLATDKAGRLLALNDSFFLESIDSGTSWARRDFDMVWPENYHQSRVALLRHVTLTDLEIGYALVVHWPLEWTRNVQPKIGLVWTTDNGRRWSHLHVFDGPDVGDVNERHITSLRVS
jgi:hypothetical protein